MINHPVLHTYNIEQLHKFLQYINVRLIVMHSTGFMMEMAVPWRIARNKANARLRLLESEV